MNNVIDILEKLFRHYKVRNVAELSEKIGITQATISNWKSRNSINAIKKKCRDLDIYNDIFSNSIENEKQQYNYFTTINSKLNLFNKPALIYLHFLIKRTDISNIMEYLNYEETKEQEKSYFSFIKDFQYDLKNDIFTISNDFKKLSQYFEYLLDSNEIDYLFKNKELFVKPILFFIKEKKIF